MTFFFHIRATSSDTNLLYDLTDKIRKNFPNRESSDFTALHAVVITWIDIKGKDFEQDSNQFQAIISLQILKNLNFLLFLKMKAALSFFEILSKLK